MDYSQFRLSDNVEDRRGETPSLHLLLKRFGLMPRDVSWEDWKNMAQHPLTPMDQLFPDKYWYPNLGTAGDLSRDAGYEDLPPLLQAMRAYGAPQ